MSKRPCNCHFSFLPMPLVAIVKDQPKLIESLLIGDQYLDKLMFCLKPIDFTLIFKPGFHYTANATTTTQKQSDYKVEQSSFTLIALF